MIRAANWYRHMRTHPSPAGEEEGLKIALEGWIRTYVPGRQVANPQPPQTVLEGLVSTLFALWNEPQLFNNENIRRYSEHQLKMAVFLENIYCPDKWCMPVYL
jgi:hypothetical protein